MILSRAELRNAMNFDSYQDYRDIQPFLGWFWKRRVVRCLHRDTQTCISLKYTCGSVIDYVRKRVQILGRPKVCTRRSTGFSPRATCATRALSTAAVMHFRALKECCAPATKLGRNVTRMFTWGQMSKESSAISPKEETKWAKAAELQAEEDAWLSESPNDYLCWGWRRKPVRNTLGSIHTHTESLYITLQLPAMDRLEWGSWYQLECTIQSYSCWPKWGAGSPFFGWQHLLSQHASEQSKTAAVWRVVFVAGAILFLSWSLCLKKISFHTFVVMSVWTILQNCWRYCLLQSARWLVYSSIVWY